jgi:hypothetical protein
MKHLLKVKQFYLILFFVLITSCANTNWLGSYYRDYSIKPMRDDRGLYFKDLFQINEYKNNSQLRLNGKKVSYKGISYFHAEEIRNGKFILSKKDLDLVGNINQTILKMLNESSLSEYSIDDDFSYFLDEKIIDNGLSSYRLNLITLEDLLLYANMSDDSEVGFMIFISEITANHSDMGYKNSTALNLILYDNQEILYNNAVASLNTFKLKHKLDISKMKEDLPLALSFLLEDLERSIVENNLSSN